MSFRYYIAILIVINAAVIHWAIARAMYDIVCGVGIAFLIFILSYRYTLKFGRKMLAAGVYGCDINKSKNRRSKLGAEDIRRCIPESVGLLTAILYVCGMSISFAVMRNVSIEMKLNSMASLFCVTMMALLGFMDDIIDIRWRYKMLLPAVASIPLVTAYTGATWVIIPKITCSMSTLGGLLATVGDSCVLDLKQAFSAYMIIFIVGCANCVNIYAGVNGLEVGQSLIVAVFCMIYQLLEFHEGKNAGNSVVAIISCIMFIHASLGLYEFNRYPSAIFVGDAYTLFSGVVFATISIYGHCAKTFLLFFVPQILNAVISLPQLTKLIPCPAHRTPLYDTETDVLINSKNWTLINLWLYARGPLHEERLTNELLCLQIATSCFGLLLRYSSLYTKIF